MKKPNGHLNMLDLTFYDDDDLMKNMKTILDQFKNNIIGLRLNGLEYLESADWVSFLLHENTTFRFLEQLTIGADNSVVDNLLRKHAKQLTFLELTWGGDQINLQNLPKFHKLETLIIELICPNTLVTLLSLCSESLSTLKIGHVYTEKPNIPLQQVPELPKLQTLILNDGCFVREIGFVEAIGKSLLSKCRQSLSGIGITHLSFDMQDIYFPKAKYLKFVSVPKEYVKNSISAHSCQLETLIIEDINDLAVPKTLLKMKNVWIKNCDNIGHILLNCAASLQCLVLEDCSSSALKGTVKMSNLTDLYLINYDYHENLFVKYSLSELFVSNADTLEFLVVKHCRTNTKCKSIEKTTVQLKKVHTVIVFNENPLGPSDRNFFKLLCPNAQIMTTEEGRGYRVETLNSRLKYLKADNFFIDHISDSLYDYSSFN